MFAYFVSGECIDETKTLSRLTSLVIWGWMRPSSLGRTRHGRMFHGCYAYWETNHEYIIWTQIEDLRRSLGKDTSSRFARFVKSKYGHHFTKRHVLMNGLEDQLAPLRADSTVPIAERKGSLQPSAYRSSRAQFKDDFSEAIRVTGSKTTLPVLRVHQREEFPAGQIIQLL